MTGWKRNRAQADACWRCNMAAAISGAYARCAMRASMISMPHPSALQGLLCADPGLPCGLPALRGLSGKAPGAAGGDLREKGNRGCDLPHTKRQDQKELSSAWKIGFWMRTGTM